MVHRNQLVAKIKAPIVMYCNHCPLPLYFNYELISISACSLIPAANEYWIIYSSIFVNCRPRYIQPTRESISGLLRLCNWFHFSLPCAVNSLAFPSWYQRQGDLFAHVGEQSKRRIQLDSRDTMSEEVKAPCLEDWIITEFTLAVIKATTLAT